MPSKDIDYDLIIQTCELVPKHTWPIVLYELTELLAITMPEDVLIKFVGEKDTTKAHKKLLSYYFNEENQEEKIILDAFDVLGEERVLFELDQLKLDKVEDTTQLQETSSS
jgi:hypothetical protein